MPNGVPFCTGFADFKAAGSCSSSFDPIPGPVGPWATSTDPAVITVSASGTFGAIKTNGTLWMWGANGDGMFSTGLHGDGVAGSAPKSSPVQTIAGGTNWASLAVGSHHVAATKADGTLWLWGSAAAGGLGNLTATTASNTNSPIQTVAGGTNWKQAAVGCFATAAVKTDGTLWTWGSNVRGGLGTDSTVPVSSPVQTIAGGTNWKSVAMGCYGPTAAIKCDGTLWLWGSNCCGMIGDGSTVFRSSPVQTISGGTNWCQVSVGLQHVGAVKTDGTLWMWGRGYAGSLATNGTGAFATPAQVTGTNWESVSASADTWTTSAIKTDGTLWNWGFGGYGLLGTGIADRTSKSSPVQTVVGGTTWKNVAGGSSRIAVKTDGTMWVWGSLYCGALGNGTTSAVIPAYQADLGRQLVEKDYLIDVYPNLIPTQKASTLWIWGNASQGALGNNSTSTVSSPVQTIAGGTNWSSLPLSSPYVSGGIKADGTLWTWGGNYYGMMGTNDTIPRSSPVQTIAGGTNWKQMDVANTHMAAIKTDGTLWTWGSNRASAVTSGGLGDNTAINRSSPVQTIAGGTNWKQVSVGGSCFTAAVKTDGTLWLWGQGGAGANSSPLGDGYGVSRSSPVQTIAGGTNWKAVSAGRNQTAAIKTDGTLWTWGTNTAGQLGDNSRTARSSPVQTVAGGNNWKQVSTGTNGLHMSAIKTDGTLWTWGRNQNGQLGILVSGYANTRSSPVQTISGGTNWKIVSAGGETTAAIKTDGTLWSWGRGTLGDNFFLTSQSSPVQTIAGGTNWKAVSARGYGGATAIREEGDW